MALISAMLGVGGALGLPFAGLVAESGDFHTLFWVTAAAAAVAFVAIMLMVPEPHDPAGGRLDVIGAILLAAALVALLLPLSEGSDWGWGSAPVIALFVVAAVCFAAFGLRELRAKTPLVDLASLAPALDPFGRDVPLEEPRHRIVEHLDLGIRHAGRLRYGGSGHAHGAPKLLTGD